MRTLLFTLSAIALLTSCGGGNEESTDTETAPNSDQEISVTGTPEDTDAPEEESAEPADPDNMFSSAAPWDQAQEALMNLPQFKGKNPNFFRQIEFEKDGDITLKIQDPSKPENIDKYEYEDGKWAEPKPVRITGGGKMEDNLKPLSSFKFSTVNKVYNTYVTEAKKLEEWNQKGPRSMTVEIGLPFSTDLEWRGLSITTVRSRYSIDFNLDGSLKELKKR